MMSVKERKSICIKTAEIRLSKLFESGGGRDQIVQIIKQKPILVPFKISKVCVEILNEYRHSLGINVPIL